MKQTTIHTSSQRLISTVLEIGEYKNLFWALANRNIKLRYRQTLLGILWVILQPLLTAGIFTAVFGKLAHLPSDGIPYFLFSFSGMLPWLFVSQCIQRASVSLIGDIPLITKIYFPRILIPFSTVLAVGVDLLVGLGMVFLCMVLYQFSFHWHLLVVPFFLFLMVLFSSGLSFFFSAMTAYYRDFIHLIPLCTQLWLYVSPVAYSSSMISERWKFLYNLNPLTGLIDGFRWAILGLPIFPWDAVLISTIETVLFFILGAMTFRKMEGYFADVI